MPWKRCGWMENEPISTLIERLDSPLSREIRGQVMRAAENSLPVLFYGETGVGKDVWVNYLHSLKGDVPFVNLHCADLPESLLESHWFGYKKGAFTGAVSDHPGLWNRADRGVLYLNRIDLLKKDLQSKLLRVIERKRFFPLGSTEEISLDAQFIFSANDDIVQQVEKGIFRADLYYRISSLSVRIPPLRERKQEILPLLKFFAFKSGTEISLSQKSLDRIQHHPWFGNIRELENFVSRCAISDERITDQEVSKHLDNGSFFSAASSRELSLEELEKEYIRTLLSRYKNKAQVARILGVTRKTLYNKLKTYGKD